LRRFVAALALAFSAAGTAAAAGWELTGDVERFRWREDTDPRVSETGPMLGIGLNWTQQRELGWRLGYRGRLYFGSVDYQGSFLGTDIPVSGRTEYSGFSNEAQLAYRFPGAPYGPEFVSGLILDYWNRQLSPDQREQYWIAALRLGLRFDRRASPGFFGAAGVKYPFWTREDAHLTDIGFNANPRLQPKGALSLYGEAGYRLNPAWSVSAYYESYRFNESAPTPRLFNPFVPGCGAPDGCTLVQPTSRAESLGLRLGYSF
jgi:opacity protein-like surface antigen